MDNKKNEFLKVYNEYLKEMVCNLNENLEQDMTESEEEMEM